MKRVFIFLIGLSPFLSKGQGWLRVNTMSGGARVVIDAASPANPSKDEGILIPRVRRFSLQAPDPLAHGMLLFLERPFITGTTRIPAGTDPETTYTSGFYYWQQGNGTVPSRWVPLLSGLDPDTIRSVSKPLVIRNGNGAVLKPVLVSLDSLELAHWLTLSPLKDSLVHVIEEEIKAERLAGNDLTSSGNGGIIVTNGRGATLKRTDLRLDSSAIAGMVGKTPVRDSILKIAAAPDWYKSGTTTGAGNGDAQYVLGNVGIGHETVLGNHKLSLYGNANNMSGPHSAAYIRGDEHPVFQQLNWSHDNINLSFDSYWDRRRWRSSSNTGNFLVSKFQREFRIHYDSSVAAGDEISNWKTAMAIRADNGNVGIGTTSPRSKLHLQGNEDIGIGFSTNGGGTPVQAQVRVTDNNWSADMIFETSEPGSGSGRLTERMRIRNNGNVGIGTTNPGARLEVGGRVKITGGSPGAGKVLTSDADGLASWQPANLPPIKYSVSDARAFGYNTVWPDITGLSSSSYVVMYIRANGKSCGEGGAIPALTKIELMDGQLFATKLYGDQGNQDIEGNGTTTVSTPNTHNGCARVLRVNVNFTGNALQFSHTHNGYSYVWETLSATIFAFR